MASQLTYGQTITREQSTQLMDQCQLEREQKIAPLREQAIEDCVNKQRRDREHCERHNENFGERSPAGAPTGMFWDLPVCGKARDAERYFRMNPRAQQYTP